MDRKIIAAWAAPLLMAGWLVTGTAQAVDPPCPGYGMMGGGPGMMGGGYGRGMMEPWWSLDLNDKQRAEIDKIMEEQHKSNWPLMSRMFEAQRKLDQLYNAEKWDGNAINKANEDLFKVQREMVESHIKTRNRIMELLTPEQREQLKRHRWENRWRN